VILATARAQRATVWTQDSDFEGLDGVKYVAKR
jgi:predicted nucleic acid-binding protein